jgi:hypothetical protein
MSAAGDGSDLFERFETELRSPREKLLVDAFLPPPAAIPSSLRRPAAARPAPDPAAPAELDYSATLSGARQRADETEEAPAPRPRRRPVKRAAQAEKSLEEEIAEFMSIRGGALAPDSDPEKG